MPKNLHFPPLTQSINKNGPGRHQPDGEGRAEDPGGPHEVAGQHEQGQHIADHQGVSLIVVTRSGKKAIEGKPKLSSRISRE